MCSPWICILLNNLVWLVSNTSCSKSQKYFLKTIFKSISWKFQQVLSGSSVSGFREKQFYIFLCLCDFFFFNIQPYASKLCFRFFFWGYIDFVYTNTHLSPFWPLFEDLMLSFVTDAASGYPKDVNAILTFQDITFPFSVIDKIMNKTALNTYSE